MTKQEINDFVELIRTDSSGEGLRLMAELPPAEQDQIVERMKQISQEARAKAVAAIQKAKAEGRL